MNVPSKLPTESSVTSPNRMLAVERTQEQQRCSPSFSLAKQTKGRGSRDNLRIIWSRIARNKDDSSSSSVSYKKSLEADNKTSSLPQHLTQSTPRKSCLKVSTLEESLLSCASNCIPQRQTVLMRGITGITDGISDDSDDDDLYGEWESTPIMIKPTTVSFGTINFQSFSDSIGEGDNNFGRSSRKKATQHSQLFETVDEYEMRRPSSQRRVMFKKYDAISEKKSFIRIGSTAGASNRLIEDVLSKVRKRTTFGQTALTVNENNVKR